jgi:hypothetical protein
MRRITFTAGESSGRRAVSTGNIFSEGILDEQDLQDVLCLSVAMQSNFVSTAKMNPLKTAKVNPLKGGAS